MKALLSAIVVLALSACGGSTAVDPIFRPEGQGGENGSTNAPPAGNDPAPIAPIGPYTGLVGTTDVSILYPMPLLGQSTDFLRPTDVGTYGALLPKAAFDIVVPNDRIDAATNIPKSGYAELALVSLRLDHCSARKGSGCTSEIRAVFQALYTTTEGVSGMAAADGGLHVIYEVSESELLTTMKQILTLKKAQGGLASQILDVHPILAQQGLDGAFAKGLRAILLEHLGAERIARITFFDHNFGFEQDGWLFTIFDRSGGTFVPKNIPKLSEERPSQIVVGSGPLDGPIQDTNVFDSENSETKDDVRPLFKINSSALALPQPAYDAALRIQNPTLHDAESTDCANCHLAEGARLRAKTFHEFSDAAAFEHARPLGYKSERTSVTNLHAFGWMHRQVSIMQRTANESVIVADWMEQKLK